MGQFSSPVRISATYPVMAHGPWMPLFPGAATVDLTFSDQTLVGTNSIVFARLYWSATSDGASPTQVGAQTATFDASAAPVTHSFNVSGVPNGSYVAGFMGSNTSGNTNEALISYSDNFTFCQYGTRPQTGDGGLVVLDANVLLDILRYVKSTPFWIVISLFLGNALDTNILCATDRPAEPVFSADDIKHLVTGTDPLNKEALLDKAGRWLRWAAWSFYCECAPGAGTPTPFPNYPATTPPGIPDYPGATSTCDNSDLCAQIDKVMMSLTALSQRVQQMDQMVTLIQRQHVPFAYILGTNHPGLTGNGQFNVQGILGLAVSASVVPAWMGRSDDTPDTIYTIGRISVGTTDGWTDLHEVRHAEQLLLDLGGEITRVGYHFEAGVTASIRELVREP